MNAIKAAIDALANALIDALPDNVGKIKAAIAQAQQYDTLGDFALDVPDEMTDIGSLANILKNSAFSPQVTHAASILAQSLDGVFVYGVTASPWGVGKPNLGAGQSAPGDEYSAARSSARGPLGLAFAVLP